MPTVWHCARNFRVLLHLTFMAALRGRRYPSVASGKQALSGVSNLLASLGHTGRRVVLGHTLNTQTLMKTDEQKKKRALSKFAILCWAA